jgi:transposase-like protein
MLQCPVCQSFQMVVVVSPSRCAWCDRCGARWTQEGGEQRAIMPEPSLTTTIGQPFIAAGRFLRADADERC